MAEPRIVVLGVYRPAVTGELVREQTDILYGRRLSRRQRSRAEQICRKQLSNVVLIEAVVYNRDSNFDAGHFTQFVFDGRGAVTARNIRN